MLTGWSLQKRNVAQAGQTQFPVAQRHDHLEHPTGRYCLLPEERICGRCVADPSKEMSEP